MKFANIRQRTAALAFAIAASVVATVVACNTVDNGQTGAASNLRDVPVNQTIQRGDVSVTLSWSATGRTRNPAHLPLRRSGKAGGAPGIAHHRAPGR